MFGHLRIFGVICVFCCADLYAGRVRGPNYFHEHAWDPSAKKSEVEKPSSISRNKLRFMAPIPARVAGGMLIGQYEYYDEVYRPNADARYHLKTHVIGASFLPRYDEGSPRWFLSLSRYGTFDHAPMYENVFGLNLEHTPFFFKPGENSDTSAYLALYVRRFPFGMKYLPILLYKVLYPGGWFFELNLPTMFYFGYNAPDYKWTIEFNAYLNALNYPWKDPDVDSGWIDGYTTNFLIGFKRHLVSYFYFTGYAGTQSSRYWYNTRREQNIYEVETRYMPIVMGGLETYIDLK